MNEDRIADRRARWTLSVVCATTGIGTFGMPIASVTRKVMYR